MKVWPDSALSQHLGPFGDFYAGTLGTAFSGITLFLLVIGYLSSRTSAKREKLVESILMMIDTHREIVNSMRVDKNNGRDTFGIILHEFYRAYKYTNKYCLASGLTWSIQEKIDIAYTAAYYGNTIVGRAELKKYGENHIKDIFDFLSRLKLKPNQVRRFSGHQRWLSHYFRNLFNAYEFIDNSGIGKKHQLEIGKVVRSNLSNYEQAVIALNVVSHFGREWESTGFMKKYQVIKNIPEKFFELNRETTIKDLFPYITFEFEKDRRRTREALLSRLSLFEKIAFYFWEEKYQDGHLIYKGNKFSN